MSRSNDLLASMMVEFPGFRLVPKSGDCTSCMIDRFLRVVTLGRQDRYLTEYFTVLGNTLYLAPRWEQMDDAARYILLCHERVHLRQRRRLGTLGMALLYLMPLFPLGLAIGRARIEWEAYCETLRATAEVHGLEAVESPSLRKQIVSRFTGADYGWMWPFPRTVSRWYDKMVDELRSSPAKWAAPSIPKANVLSEES